MASIKKKKRAIKPKANAEASKPHVEIEARVEKSEGAVWEGFPSSRAAWAIFALAFLLRIPDLGVKSLWVDEMVDWGYTTKSWDAIFQTAHWGTYALQKILFGWGQHEFLLRLPCAAFGLLGIWWLYGVARRIASERVAFIAAALLTFSPLHIYYSQDSHYYGMMIGLATLAMVFLVRMISSRSLLDGGMMLVAAYFAYKVHPAAAFVPAACVGTAGLWVMVDQTLIRQALGQIKRLTHVGGKAMGWGAIGLVCMVLCWLLYRFDSRVVSVMLSGSAEEINATPNFEISFAFFSRVLSDFLGALFNYSVLNLAVSFVVFAFAMFGLILLFRRNKWLAVHFLMLFAAPWVALSIKHYEHFFHDRYVSFMVPGLVLCAAIGVDAAASKLAGGFQANRGTDGKFYGMAVGVFFALWAIVVVPNLARYYLGEKQDWKGAVEYLDAHAPPGARVASYLHCNQTSLNFYRGYFGTDSFDLLKLREVPQSPSITIAQLKRYCREERPLYIDSSYQRYEPEDFMNWVRKNSELVFDSPTLHPEEFNFEGKNVEVYRFSYSGRFVQAPFTCELTVGGDGSYEEMFLFDRAGRYEMSVEGNAVGSTEGSAAFSLDGVPVGTMTLTAQPSKSAGVQFDAAAGPHRITLGLTNAALSKLRIETVWGESLRITANAPSALHTSIWNVGGEDESRNALVMKRNSVAAYDIELPEGSARYVRIEARHDAPAPVVMEVALDGSALGVLAWSKGDNSWEALGLPFTAGAGPHRLELTFLNEGNIAADLTEDADRDAWLDSIEFFATPPTAGTDQRMREGDVVAPDVGYVSRAMDWGQESARKAWASSMPERLEFVPDPFGGTGTVARLSVPAPSTDSSVSPEKDPARQSVFVQAPPAAVQDGQTLHFSAYYRMEKLDNHSANMLVVWLDANRRVIQQSPVNQEGITEANTLQNDFGWIRTVALSQAPAGARWVMPVIWVHANGTMPSEDPGALFVRNPRFENVN